MPPKKVVPKAAAKPAAGRGKPAVGAAKKPAAKAPGKMLRQSTSFSVCKCNYIIIIKAIAAC